MKGCLIEDFLAFEVVHLHSFSLTFHCLDLSLMPPLIVRKDVKIL